MRGAGLVPRDPAGHCIRVTVSESLYPSYFIRVTVSESLYPSHCIRVTLSESLYPSHCIRVTVSVSWGWSRGIPRDEPPCLPQRIQAGKGGLVPCLPRALCGVRHQASTATRALSCQASAPGFGTRLRQPAGAPLPAQHTSCVATQLKARPRVQPRPGSSMWRRGRAGPGQPLRRGGAGQAWGAPQWTRVAQGWQLAADTGRMPRKPCV